MYFLGSILLLLGLTSSTVVGDFAQITRSYAVEPTTVPPLYHVTDNIEMFVTDNFPEYFCVDVFFTNDWNRTSTHWSASFIVNGVSRLGDIWTGQSQVSRVRPGVFLGILRSIDNEGSVLPGLRKKVGFCADKAVRGQEVAYPTGHIMTGIITPTVIFSIGLTNPPVPAEGALFNDYINTIDLEPFDDCMTPVPLVNDFQIIIENSFSIDNGIVGGSIAAGGDIAITSMFRALGKEQCGVCGSGDIGKYTLVSNGQISFPDAPPEGTGLCSTGSVASGAPLPAGSALSSLNEGCLNTGTGTQLIDFTSAFQEYRELSAELARKYDTGSSGQDFQLRVMHLLFFRNNFSPRQAVISIPAEVLTTSESGLVINDIVAMAAHDIIVFNVRGIDVTFNFYTSWGQLAIANAKIIWNFPDARIIHISDGAPIQGTILAPYADITSSNDGTKIYGNVIARSFTGRATEFYRFDWKGFVSESVERECYMCAEGNFGEQCSECTGCSPNQRCNEGSENNGQCVCRDGFDSSCNDCVDDLFGAQCDFQCEATCLSRGSCNDGINGNGSCSCSSQSNFAGEQCEMCTERWSGIECDECAEGFYGPSCEFECTESCLANGVCSSGLEGDGSCECSHGFSGLQCNECAPGFYGPSCAGQCTLSCLTNGVCNDGKEGDGSCTGCVSPYTGDFCDECENPLNYGPGCALVCDSRCSNGACDSGPDGSGRCLCDAGWSGRFCDQAVASSAGAIVLSFYITFLLVLWFFFV